MLTRQDYLNHKCTHAEYYSQFVTDQIKDNILNRFGIENLINSHDEDESFNSDLTPLYKWGSYYNPKKFKTLGDFQTLAGAVCLEKEAARQIVESFNTQKESK